LRTRVGTVNGTNGTDGTDGTVNGTVNEPAGAENGIDTGNNGASNYEAVLLKAIQENPKSTFEALAKQASLSRRAIAREMKKLQDAGKIRRVGSDKTGHWEVSGKL
jgi:predicted HTH transcriptional regulator